MPSILILFAHAHPYESRVNRAMLDAVDGVEGIVTHDLYATYPDFHIDVRREQALCEAAGVIVMQHPVQWYGSPSLLKEWIDRVLEHGWAFGNTGTALAGKTLLSAVSAGGTEESYRRDGEHRHDLRDFLLPFAETARLCGMTYAEPIILYGANHANAGDLAAHAAAYRDHLIRLRDS